MKFEPEFDTVITGRINYVLDSLNRSLAQFISNNKKVKVGATGREPLKRLGEHLLNTNWKRCIVKFETTSKDVAATIEDELIQKFKRKLANKTGGGGGLTYNSNIYYVYFLIR